MRNFIFSLLALLTSITLVRSDESPVKGGISPDGNLAVIVVSNGHKKASSDAEVPIAYLINNRTKKKIGPLEELDLGGDDVGRGEGNAEAFWSKDSRLLAINSDHGFSFDFDTIYEIDGKRAIPQNVETPMVSSLVNKVVSPRGHSSENFSRWINDSEFDMDLDNYLPSGGTARYREIGKKWIVVKFTLNSPS